MNKTASQKWEEFLSEAVGPENAGELQRLFGKALAIRELADKLYSLFEKLGLTVKEATGFVENAKERCERIHETLHYIRNDMSTHMSDDIHETFDRTKHTHGGYDWPSEPLRG